MTRGIPSTAELAQAVREFLEQEMIPATEGRLKFHARVAANVMAQVERELQSGLPDTTTDVELCAAIRAGSVDFEQAYDAIRETVVAKLRISNPRHLLPEDR
jgi:signal transduction histidine kinase